ncbi:Metallo-hydrolase/oxidoreductase superfamily protein, partial [Prunus dulcis]
VLAGLALRHVSTKSDVALLDHFTKPEVSRRKRQSNNGDEKSTTLLAWRTTTHTCEPKSLFSSQFLIIVFIRVFLLSSIINLIVKLQLLMVIMACWVWINRIIDESTKEAAAVDPVEPERVLKAAQEHGVDIKLVLTTHHHWDHAGGNEKIKQLVPGIKIYGGSIDNVKGCTDKVDNGDKISLGADVHILSLHTPCHTKGHISYYVTNKEGDDPTVFTGDTLFIAGCGKFFEGTAEQMHQSLCVTLGSLPKPTRVYCGHEYTVKNLQFALTVEPGNEKIKQKLSWAQKQRETGLPTVPSTIEEEMEMNPFMRADLPELQERVGCKTAVEALREIRQRKDTWRG